MVAALQTVVDQLNVKMGPALFHMTIAASPDSRQ